MNFSMNSWIFCKSQRRKGTTLGQCLAPYRNPFWLLRVVCVRLALCSDTQSGWMSKCALKAGVAFCKGAQEVVKQRKKRITASAPSSHREAALVMDVVLRIRQLCLLWLPKIVIVAPKVLARIGSGEEDMKLAELARRRLKATFKLLLSTFLCHLRRNLIF